MTIWISLNSQMSEFIDNMGGMQGMNEQLNAAMQEFSGGDEDGGRRCNGSAVKYV